MTKDSSAKRKTGKRKPEKLSFTQDFIPIKNLEHGIIETTDGRYIKILEIEPINFMLRSEEEQYEIICSFASWLKISPVHLQFKSITRKADSDKHIAMLRKEMESEESEQCKLLSEGYIRLIKDVGSREALTRRFFLIFRYEELRRNENSDYGQICSTLLTAEQNARAYFMQCGNNILQPKDPDEATAEILYMFFNRRSCIEEPFHSRVDRIVLDTMAAISATQDLSDFFGLEDGRYGRAIINNSKNKIILNLEPDEAEFVRDTLKLTKTEIRSITRFERGEALICSNNSKVPVIIRASKEEQEMITTDRAELEAILKERQHEAD